MNKVRILFCCALALCLSGCGSFPLTGINYRGTQIYVIGANSNAVTNSSSMEGDASLAAKIPVSAK